MGAKQFLIQLSMDIPCDKICIYCKLEWILVFNTKGNATNSQSLLPKGKNEGERIVSRWDHRGSDKSSQGEEMEKNIYKLPLPNILRSCVKKDLMNAMK